MKIDELISELEQIKQEHGNLEIEKTEVMLNFKTKEEMLSVRPKNKNFFLTS